MEFVDGTNLDQLVRQRGRHLPEAEALGYVAEVAAALTVLHANGVLHRDIKPANIMIDKPGHAVLIDFGTARDFVPDKTLTHSVTLTPAFAPPEQFQPRARRGPFTDIYALAATTYWLLTGDLLDMWDTSKVNEDERLTPRVRTALTHALVFNPHERTPDAASFITELSGQTPIAAPPVRQFGPSAPTEPNRPAYANKTIIEPIQPFDEQRYIAEVEPRLRRRFPVPLLGGGVAAVALLSVLAIVLLVGSKGNSTNTTGGVSDTPTAAQVALATPVSSVEFDGSPMIAQTQPTGTPTNTPVPPTNAPIPPTVTSISSLSLNGTDLFSVYMISAIEGWAVGGGGTILHYSGGTWTKVSSPTDVSLNSVAMISANEGWAVGRSTILHYSGGSWTKVSIPSSDWLDSVAMVSASEAWAVGNGTIMHFSGGSWTEVDSPPRGSLYSVAMVSANEGWAVGDIGILHYSGGSWTKVSSPARSFISNIAMASASEGWAVGSYGTILHYSGGSWTKVSSPNESLNSVAMVSANEGWAVGYTN
jgi:photosystem II stability/assembly factor-like uncharacterized protein